MELPYVVACPTWTSNGYYSMTTRPGLAVHRSHYNSVPRLFPVRTSAQQLTLPINNSLNRLQNDSSFTWIEKDKFVDKQRDPRILPLASGHNPFSSNDFNGHSPQDTNTSSSEVKKQLLNWNNDIWKNIHAPQTRGSTIPVQLSIDYIKQSKSSTEDDYLHLPNKADQTTPRSSDNTSNSLCYVRDGDQNIIVFTSSGTRDNLTACPIQLETDENGCKKEVLCSNKRNSLLRSRLQFDKAYIQRILSWGCTCGSNERPRILTMTSNSLSFAQIEKEQNNCSLQWKDDIFVPSLLSCALNPICPDEFAALSYDGLFSGTVDSFYAAKKASMVFEDIFSDIQPIAKSAKYRSVNYGMHPRTFYINNRKEIILYDIRSKQTEAMNNVLVNLDNDWGLPSYDRQIACIEPLEGDRRSRMIVATKTCLNYIDVRMPHTPLLDWSLSVPIPVDHMSVTTLPDVEGYNSDVIAISSRQQNFLEVFHAIDVKGWSGSLKPFQKDINDQIRLPELPKEHILWSDLALAHLQQLRPNAEIAGMTLLPHKNTSFVSLVQWSPEDGLLAQLLNIRTQKDDSLVSFESTPPDRPHLDNTLNITNWQRALIRSGQFKPSESVRHPVTHSVPGSYLHQRAKRIFVEDAMDLQKRIIKNDEDDISDDGREQLPRPYLGDLETVRRMRQLSGEDADDMGNLLDSIGGGRTLDEIARVTRSGMAHASTPLGPGSLREALESSPFVSWYDVEWHAGCNVHHEKDGPATTTDDPLPPWVQRRVYYESTKSRPKALSIVEVPEESQYGKMLTRMQDYFFNDDDTHGDT